MSAAMQDSGPIGSEAVPSRPSAWARLRGNTLATQGLIIVTLIVLVATAAPVLPLLPPNTTEPANRLMPVLSEGHPLGTDQLGRDILSRLIWGTGLSLSIGLAATLVATLIGSAIGLIAAMYGRWVDTVLMRCIDVLMAFPYLLLALAIVAALGPGLLNALLAIAIVNIPFFARAVRGSTLSLVEREFIEAARMMGYSKPRIIVSEILPNVLPVIIITMSTTVGWMILETAGLSFLGLGAQPPTADLGSMLADGRNQILVAPHVAIIPGMLILVLVIGINLLGDGMRDVLDPRLKSGALSRPVAATVAADRKTRRNAAERFPGPYIDNAQTTLLSVNGLETQFTIGREVYRSVNGVSFAIARGEAVGVIGESGSGKSVTALSVLGLVATPPGRIAGGEVRYFPTDTTGEDLVGAPLSRLQDLRGDRIAYIFQDPLTTLNPLISVGEQVAEAVERHQGVSGSAAWARALELLGLVRIPDPESRAKSYPHQLSGGQRQRVVIAMALANDPDLLIADEPTTALDVTTQAQILKLIDTLRREKNAALLFISHDFGVISEMCDRVLVMYAGRIVEEGSVETVFADPRHPYTRRLMACVPVLGEPERAIDAIPGLPPAVNRLPDGCAFAPRCHLALEACRHGEIAHDWLTPSHAARCIRAREIPVLESSVP